MSGASFAQDELKIFAAAEARVGVLLPLSLRGVYDYAVPPGLTLFPGDYVAVPLRDREEMGVVWGPGRGDVAASKLKTVLARFDAPPMPEATRRFVEWVAQYTVSSPGAVLDMALPRLDVLAPPTARPALAANADFVPARPLTAQRERGLAVLRAEGPLSAADLARSAGVSAAIVKALVDIGAAVPADLSGEDVNERAPDPDAARVELSPAQQEAAATLRQAVKGGYSATLLEGVTGSGKTEVYFEAIAEAIRAGRQALVLVPEIALSVAWVERFRRRFGARPAAWRDGMGIRERRRVWRGVASGQIKAVIGVRTALFLPFPKLGLIVVDEEHDSTFKRTDGVPYHARDMAVARAHSGGFPVILASATPALETLANVEAGRYRHLMLPERHGGATMPSVHLVDMRRHPPPPRRWLSDKLVGALGDTLAAGEQAMLFLNRRGYAPVTVCRRCGTKLKCPRCSAWLVEHRLIGRLQCHQCGKAYPMPDACPEGHPRENLVACGPGVERLVEEVKQIFGERELKLAVMSSDNIHDAADAQAIVERMQRREIEVLVGTQLVAKGHDFPMLTLVGVVDADLSLGGGDLRAGERTWQVLSQVAGRAGRGERAGRVLVQTYMPEHPVLRAIAAADRDGFVAAEMEARRQAGYPPFGRLAAIIVSAKEKERGERAARDLARAWPGGDGVEIFGPAPAPIAVVRERHRFRLLVKARKDVTLQPLIRKWLAAAKQPSGVRVKVDIDPYSFL